MERSPFDFPWGVPPRTRLTGRQTVTVLGYLAVFVVVAVLASDFGHDRLGLPEHWTTPLGFGSGFTALSLLECWRLRLWPGRRYLADLAAYWAGLFVLFALLHYAGAWLSGLTVSTAAGA